MQCQLQSLQDLVSQQIQQEEAMDALLLQADSDDDYDNHFSDTVDRMAWMDVNIRPYVKQL
jgi:hypothetical protein